MKTDIYTPYPLVVPHNYLAPVRKVCAGERAVGSVGAMELWKHSLQLFFFLFFFLLFSWSHGTLCVTL